MLFVRVWDYIIVREVRIRFESDVFVSESAYQCLRVRISVRSDVFVSESAYQCLRLRISV